MDIFPISIDFSALDDKLKPLYEMKHEIQELTITLRNMDEKINHIPELIDDIESFNSELEGIRRQITTILNKKNEPKKKKKKKRKAANR